MQAGENLQLFKMTTEQVKDTIEEGDTDILMPMTDMLFVRAKLAQDQVKFSKFVQTQGGPRSNI